MKIQTIADKLTGDMALKIDAHIMTKVKPKPKYLPKFIWHWLIKKLFFIEIK